MTAAIAIAAGPAAPPPALPAARAGTPAGAVAAQLVRFTAVGVGASLVQFGLFFVLYDLGGQLANLAGVVVSSALANEMHRRLTFRAGSRVGWLTAQREGGTLSAVALVVTSLALALADDVVGGGRPAQALLIVTVNAVAGLTRFVLLRRWVFADAARGARPRRLNQGSPGPGNHRSR